MRTSVRVVELTPSHRGAIAELAVMFRAREVGCAVYRPVVEGCRCDMILGVGASLVRVQCKSARVHRGAVIVNARTSRVAAGGRYVRGTYTAEEVDAIVAYCHDNRTCYLIPIGHVPPNGSMHLRLAPAKNNQLKRLNFAADYEFSLGAIAQLGERVTGSHEVAGSSPASSTS